MESNTVYQSQKRRAACDPCRKRKVRCSGGSPVCQRCSELGLSTCHYSDTGRIGRPRRPRPNLTARQTKEHYGNGVLDAQPGQDSDTAMAACGTHLPPDLLFQSPLPLPDFDLACFDSMSWLNLPANSVFTTTIPQQRLPAPGADASTASSLQAIVSPNPAAPQPQSQPGTPSSSSSPPPPQNRSPNPLTCTCTALVHAHLPTVAQTFTTATDKNSSPAPTLRHLHALRAATAAAEQLLTCAVCFDSAAATGYGGVSGNVYLLAGLLGSVGGAYGRFWESLVQVGVHFRDRGQGGEGRLHQPQQDEDGNLLNAGCGDEQQTVEVFVGHGTGEDEMVALSVGREEYMALIKAGVRSDVAWLEQICKRFEQRQIKLHSQGHERCVAGRPCLIKDGRAGGRGLTFKEQLLCVCPEREGDMKRRYACFQAVAMAWSVIRELEGVLDGAGIVADGHN